MRALVQKIFSVTMAMSSLVFATQGQASVHPQDAALLRTYGRNMIANSLPQLQHMRGQLQTEGAKAYVTWKYLTVPNTIPPISEILSFMQANPDWPRASILREKLEKSLLSAGDATQMGRYFSANPPMTWEAKKRYFDLLLQTSSTQAQAVALIKKSWTEDILTASQQSQFLASYRRFLNSHDYDARMNFLMNNHEIIAVASFMGGLSPTGKQIYAVRTSLIRLEGRALGVFQQSATAVKNNLGVLRDLVHYYRKTNQDTKAITVMTQLPTHMPAQEAVLWLPHRLVMSRVAFKNKRPDLAYKIVVPHGLNANNIVNFKQDIANFVDSAWYAGFLSLRFLKNPTMAKTHFQQALNVSKMPISRSRGLYWLARAENSLGHVSQAKAYYQQAGQYFYTYYGQLALREQGVSRVNMPQGASVSPQIRLIYQNNNLVQAASFAQAAGYGHETKIMLMHIANRDKVAPAIFPLLLETVKNLGYTEMQVKIAKLATLKNVFEARHGFPMIAAFNAYRQSPYISVYRALTRQESEYDAVARSPVGASGLMQIMPTTARIVAQKIGKAYNPSMMTNPAYNIALGTNYLKGLLQNFNGSYTKSLAGYNAGPMRIGQWTQSYGKQTNNLYQAIDWIEMIPYGETRNYVQRILESIQIYRTLERGDQIIHINTPEDLRRGV